jgi:hypothetical protein
MKNASKALAVLLIGGLFTEPLYATAFLVTVNSTPLTGQSGYMALDFTAGLPVPGNAAVITGFASDSTLGASSGTGDVTGTLIPGPLTLTDAQFFNEWLQSISAFGTTLSFQVDLGSNVSPGGSPDSFAVFLLDSRFVPFATSDPTNADALLAIDLNGPNTSPEVYTSSFATATVRALTGNIPEPATWLLIVTGAPFWMGQLGRKIGGGRRGRIHRARDDKNEQT